MNGYASEGYAISLSEFGQPRFLPMSEGWIQERLIQNSSQKDARAMYPLFSCNKWTHLPQDLDVLQQDSGLVSLVIVTDPFGDYDEGLLHYCFPDLVRPFKRHYLVDMISPFQVLNIIVITHVNLWRRYVLRLVLIPSIYLMNGWRYMEYLSVAIKSQEFKLFLNEHLNNN